MLTPLILSAAALGIAILALALALRPDLRHWRYQRWLNRYGDAVAASAVESFFREIERDLPATPAAPQNEHVS